MAHAITLSFNASHAEQPGLVAWLVKTFAQHREYLATYRELALLSDDQLADIGISRLDVGEIARVAVYAS